MIGTTISHYRIDAELGRGGMGVVYKAYDQKLQREVALKVLRDEIISAEDRRDRVLAEARAASPLNHPGIATIYEVGEEGDLLFIVMELVTGRTLREAAKTDSIGPRSLARYGIQVSEALSAAHARAVVHGDVKPENIVIDDGDRLKLLDFGVAREIATEAVTATIAGNPTIGLTDDQVAGTLAYMAPERLQGDPTDPRSDLFSLGVVLYEISAGHRPFPGPDATTLVSQLVHLDAPPLSSTDSSVPSELSRIVHKLLEKSPESRYQSAREAKVDLANLERDLDLGPSLSATLSDRRATAVLPFKLLTPNPADDYLRLALADAVIAGLSANEQLLLRPSSTIMRYLNEPVDPLLAARELNVEIIIEGSIQKAGPKMRAHVQVWNAKDGSTLLSTKHDAGADDLFGLQDQIIESLLEVLGVAALGEQVPPTKNPRAYELFLRAVDRLSMGNRWDARSAIEMLRTVTELDPNFAEAWARLAQACLMLAIGFEPEAAWFEAAEEAAERALTLDRNNANAQVAHGRLLWAAHNGFQNRPALRALGKAVRIDPNSHQAITWQSLIFLHVGLLEEAREGLAGALRMQPDDPFALNFVAQALQYQGDLDQAVEYQKRALSVDPTHLWANLFQPDILIRRGEFDRAEKQIATAKNLLGDDQYLISTEALLWAHRGDRQRSLETLQMALNQPKALAHTHHAWHTAAATYALLEMPSEAVDSLDKAAQMGLPNYPAFRDDPHFQVLQTDERFHQLMAGLRRDRDEYRREFSS